MFTVQSGDDLPGTRRLGDQGSAPEGDGGTHHQRQVGPPPPRGCAPGERGGLLALTCSLSASVNGDVRFFEPRAADSINVLQTVKGLTALDIHPQANLFAWSVESADFSAPGRRHTHDLCSLRSSGSMNQFIAVYNANGDVISNIKYYDGFMGQRIGAISCLAFHPFWVKAPGSPSSRGPHVRVHVFMF